MNRSIIRKSAIVVLILIILNILSVILYWNVSESYSENSYTNSFDCGIVFFHSITKQGDLSKDSKERCNLAVKMLNNGSIKNIICVGGSSLNKPGSKMMKEYITGLGIPDSIVLSDSLSYSSITNLKEADKIIVNKKFKSALLISSPTHMLRLKYLSEKQFFNIKKEYLTFKYEYSLFDIYLDCNSEFIKWVYLLLLPDSFTEYSRKLIRN